MCVNSRISKNQISTSTKSLERFLCRSGLQVLLLKQLGYRTSRNVAPFPSDFGHTFTRLPEWGLSTGCSIHVPISLAMSMDLVHSEKSACGMAFRFMGVSMVVGRIPITLNPLRYESPLSSLRSRRNLRATFRLVLDVTDFLVISPNVCTKWWVATLDRP